MTDSEKKLCCTVVSIVPFQIIEQKPGLIPGYYTLPASNGKDPIVVVVKEAKHNVYIDDTRGSLPVRDASDEVARSIVEDFLNSQLGCNDTAHPGIFFVVGAKTVDEVKKDHALELARAAEAQKLWFIEICKIADNDWNRYHQHNVISDFQRKAAELLGYTKVEHEWMAPNLVMASTRCPACNTSVTPGLAICPACRCILDAEKYKTFQFAKTA